MRWLLLLSVVAACGNSKTKSEPETAACDLAGTYRLRFGAIGQWIWVRFRVEGQPGAWRARTIAPRAFESSDHAVAISQDGQRCSFTATIKGKHGPVFAQVNLDPATGDVKGSIRGKDARDPSKPLSGVRDVGKQKSKLYCVHPGRYELSVPNEQPWKSDNQNQSCDKASIKVPFLVEYLGDQLVIDQLDDDGTAAWAGEDVVEKGPCEWFVRFRHHRTWIAANLTFAGDKVTASAPIASIVIEDQGGHWTCETKNPMIWVEAKPN